MCVCVYIYIYIYTYVYSQGRAVRDMQRGPDLPEGEQIYHIYIYIYI